MVQQIKTPLTGMSYKARLAEQLDKNLPAKSVGSGAVTVVKDELIEKARDELRRG